MKTKIIKINGKLYNQLAMYGGRGYFGHILDNNNDLILQGIIWEMGGFEYCKEYVNNFFTFLRWINKKLGNIHFHDYQPIASQYQSFHVRKIAYGCKCGKTKVKIVKKGFDEPFPYETNIMISDSEFNKIIKDWNHRNDEFTVRDYF